MSQINRYAIWFSVLMLVLAMIRLAGGNWGNFFRHIGFHVFVLIWIGLASYKLRTVGTKEVVHFWLLGFFPVALLAYLLTEPVERWIGTGNVQTGLWVPLVEEAVKLLPILAWTTVLRPKHRHGTLSDFVLLGFAVGAGFSFHEDALYERLTTSGFIDGVAGTLFPTFLSTPLQYVAGHGAWTALGAVGIGVFSLYRRRGRAWIVALGLMAFPVLDHAAVNWQGGGRGFLQTIAGGGQVAAVLLILVVFGSFLHDYLILRWAGQRDHLFPALPVAADLNAVAEPGPFRIRTLRLGRNQRYRRLRNAAFTDLYRVRSQGRSAGDRQGIIDELTLRSPHRKA